MECVDRQMTMADNDPIPGVRRDVIVAKIRHVFPGRDEEAVLTQLRAYGSRQHETDVERVYLAILKLCDEQGAADPSAYVERAKQDPRDIIAWAESPNLMAFGPTGDQAKKAELRRRDNDQYRAWLAKTG